MENDFDQVQKNLQKISRNRIRHPNLKAVLKLMIKLGKGISRKLPLLIQLAIPNLKPAMKRKKWTRNLRLFWLKKKYPVKLIILA